MSCLQALEKESPFCYFLFGSYLSLVFFFFSFHAELLTSQGTILPPFSAGAFVPVVPSTPTCPRTPTFSFSPDAAVRRSPSLTGAGLGVSFAPPPPQQQQQSSTDLGAELASDDFDLGPAALRGESQGSSSRSGSAERKTQLRSASPSSSSSPARPGTPDSAAARRCHEAAAMTTLSSPTGNPFAAGHSNTPPR